MLELSAREAGLVIGVAKSTIRRYVIDGILPAERRGIRLDIRIEPDKLRDFAKKYNFNFDEDRLDRLVSKK